MNNLKIQEKITYNVEPLFMEDIPDHLENVIKLDVLPQLKARKIQYAGLLDQMPLNPFNIMQFRLICTDGIVTFYQFLFYKKKAVGIGRNEFMGWYITSQTPTVDLDSKSQFLKGWTLDKNFKNSSGGADWVRSGDAAHLDAREFSKTIALKMFEKHLKEQAKLANYKYAGHLLWGPNYAVSRDALLIHTEDGPVEIVVTIFRDVDSVLNPAGRLMVPKDQVPLACAWHESE